MRWCARGPRGGAIYSRVREAGSSVAAGMRPTLWLWPATMGGHGKVTREATDEPQSSRRRVELGDKRRKKPRREQRRSATGFPWVRGDEHLRRGLRRGRWL